MLEHVKNKGEVQFILVRKYFVNNLSGVPLSVEKE